MMAILPIPFIVILRKQRISDKYLSHSHEVTGNVQVNKFGNRSLSHCLIADANILLVKSTKQHDASIDTSRIKF